MIDKHLTNEEKLDRVYQLALENHEILDGMRKRDRIASSVQILYWLVVVGAIGGAYYYIKPVIDGISHRRAEVDATLNQFEQLRSSLPQTKALGEFLNSLKQSMVATTTSEGQ